jgi:hypothetical protein
MHDSLGSTGAILFSVVFTPFPPGSVWVLYPWENLHGECTIVFALTITELAREKMCVCVCVGGASIPFTPPPPSHKLDS